MTMQKSSTVGYQNTLKSTADKSNITQLHNTPVLRRNAIIVNTFPRAINVYCRQHRSASSQCHTYTLLRSLHYHYRLKLDHHS